MKNNLKEIRLAAGLSQTELAKKVGTQQPSIAKYEKGQNSIENMTLKMAAAIADACSCDISDLMRDDFGRTK